MNKNLKDQNIRNAMKEINKYTLHETHNINNEIKNAKADFASNYFQKKMEAIIESYKLHLNSATKHIGYHTKQYSFIYTPALKNIIKKDITSKEIADLYLNYAKHLLYKGYLSAISGTTIKPVSEKDMFNEEEMFIKNTSERFEEIENYYNKQTDFFYKEARKEKWKQKQNNKQQKRKDRNKLIAKIIFSAGLVTSLTLNGISFIKNKNLKDEIKKLNENKTELSLNKEVQNLTEHTR